VEKMKQKEEMTTDFNLLRRRLETERESLLEELKTTAFVAAGGSEVPTVNRGSWLQRLSRWKKS